MSALLALDPVPSLVLRLCLGLLLLVSCWGKLRDLAGFRGAVANYRLLPTALVGAASVALLFAELVAGMALLAPAAARAGAGLAAGLLALYSAAIAVNLARGRREMDCGCAGPGRRRALSGALVARNAVLVLAAALCALPQTGREWLWVDVFTLVAGVASLSVLYASVDATLANAPRLRALREKAWSTH